MKNIDELDKALVTSMESLQSQIQFDMETFSQTHDDEYLTKDDMEEIVRQVFYTFGDFKDNIISYLKDNVKP